MTGPEPRGDFALVYAVEPKDLDSIVEPEVVFGTTKLLPPLEVIPSEFHDSANLYVQVKPW